MNYEKWKPVNVIPNSQLNSIIVVNNAPHNNTSIKKSHIPRAQRDDE
jgi:hypothetical protein